MMRAPLLAALLALAACPATRPSTADGSPRVADAGGAADAAPAVDSGVPLGDAGIPDSGALDSSVPDATEPDAGTPDAAVPDAAPQTLPQGCVQGAFQAYRGNLHSHTSYSDGQDTPAVAFQFARTTAGLDFLAVTDHLEQLYWINPLDRWGKCRAQADAADAPGSFVATCGFEYGSGFSGISSTGHNNVFFSPSLFPAVQLDFHDFYASLSACAACLGQFNHPGDEAEQHWNHFLYDAAVDARMRLFEFNGSGPAWDLFRDALDQGWHVAPAFNQDNHSADWGTANTHRTGAYLASLDRASLQEGLGARRTFMSQDQDAALVLMGAGVCWMGAVLSGVFSLPVEARAQDPDPGDGFTRLELWGPERTLLASQECGGAPACRVSGTLATPGAGTYVVARAQQADGDVLVSAPLWLLP